MERILEYTNLPPERPVEMDEKAMKANHPSLEFDKWPTKGKRAARKIQLFLKITTNKYSYLSWSESNSLSM